MTRHTLFLTTWWVFFSLALWLAASFELSIHQDITEEALKGIVVTIDGQKVKFTSSAIDDIVRGNLRTDISIAGQLLSNAFYHCDGETLPGCSDRMRQKKFNAISNTPTDPTTARTDIGGGLHTLQDFYAHSNWVNLGRDYINADLGRSILNQPDPNKAFCQSDGVTLLANPSGLLTTGFWDFRCKFPAGKCHHGRGNSCPGINKDGPSSPLHINARRLATDATVDYLTQILLTDGIVGTDRLTFARLLSGQQAASRRRHALVLVPCWSPDHDEASISSLRAGSKGSSRKVDRWPEVQNSTGPWIITPPSFMTEEAVEEGASAPRLSFATLVLHDQQSQLPYDARSKLMNFMSVALAQKGHDVDNSSSELRDGSSIKKSLQAILAAVESAPDGTALYWIAHPDLEIGSGIQVVEADADAALLGLIIAKAQAKRVEVTVLPVAGTGERRQDEFAWTQLLAQDTGGHALAPMDAVQTAHVLDFLRLYQHAETESVDEHVVTLARFLGSPEMGQDVTFVVDSTVTRVFLFISWSSSRDSPELKLIGPAGIVVDSSGAGPEVYSVDTLFVGGNALISLAAPKAGRYILSLQGEYAVTVQGSSDLYISSLESVEPFAGRFQDMYKPVAGRPLEQGEWLARLRMRYSYRSVSFSFLQNGEASIFADVVENDPIMHKDDILLRRDMEINTSSFYVMAHGVNSKGENFQRIWPRPFSPQQVHVRLAQNDVFSMSNLHYGSTTSVDFTIVNTGAIDTELAVLVSTKNGFAVSVSPSVVNVLGEGRAEVSVAITPMGTCQDQVFVDVTVAVGSASEGKLNWVTETFATGPCPQATHLRE